MWHFRKPRKKFLNAICISNDFEIFLEHLSNFPYMSIKVWRSDIKSSLYLCLNSPRNLRDAVFRQFVQLVNFFDNISHFSWHFKQVCDWRWHWHWMKVFRKFWISFRWHVDGTNFDGWWNMWMIERHICLRGIFGEMKFNIF